MKKKNPEEQQQPQQHGAGLELVVACVV